MLDDVAAPVSPAPVIDVDNAFGKFRFLENLREAHRGDAGGLGGFDHNGIAAGERGGDFPRSHEQRKVPRDDLADDAEGFGGAAGESVLELVRPAGGDKRNGAATSGRSNVAGFPDTAVHGFEHGEFAGFFLMMRAMR